MRVARPRSPRACLRPFAIGIGIGIGGTRGGGGGVPRNRNDRAAQQTERSAVEEHLGGKALADQFDIPLRQFGDRVPMLTGGDDAEGGPRLEPRFTRSLRQRRACPAGEFSFRRRDARAEISRPHESRLGSSQIKPVAIARELVPLACQFRERGLGGRKFPRGVRVVPPAFAERLDQHPLFGNLRGDARHFGIEVTIDESGNPFSGGNRRSLGHPFDKQSGGRHVHPLGIRRLEQRLASHRVRPRERQESGDSHAEDRDREPRPPPRPAFR